MGMAFGQSNTQRGLLPLTNPDRVVSLRVHNMSVDRCGFVCLPLRIHLPVLVPADGALIQPWLSSLLLLALICHVP